MELEDDTAVIEDFADLAAIGTISDVVNLTGENRAIVKAGLRSINNRSRAGINELLDVAGAGNKYVNATSVAFTISPRINAAGRMAPPTVRSSFCSATTPRPQTGSRRR